MILTTSSGEAIENPTNEQISESLSALNVSLQGVGWLVLGRSDMDYLQVSADKTLGFAMEYQEGDVDTHYRAARDDFGLNEVAQALSEFLDGTIDWSVYGNWSHVTW